MTYKKRFLGWIVMRTRQGSRSGRARDLRRAAFTLIELLVVISIIALLVSMLVPSLKQAKDLAKRATCSTNLRGIGTAAFMYTQDNEGVLPYTTGEAGRNSVHIFPMYNRYNGLEVLDHFYVQNVRGFLCPSDEGANPERPHRSYDTCYGVADRYVFGYCNPGPPLGTTVQFEKIERAGTQLMAADSTKWIELRRRKKFGDFRAVEGRHGGTEDDPAAVIVFVDLHVEAHHGAGWVNMVSDFWR